MQLERIAFEKMDYIYSGEVGVVPVMNFEKKLPL